MVNELSGRKIVFMTANEGVEQVELTRPWQAIEAAGGQPVLAAPKDGTVQAFNHLDKADTFDVDVTTANLRTEDFDGLVLPGGVANPDQLRMDGAATHFIQEFFAAGQPAAVICHGPWTLVEANVVRDRTLTSWPSLQTDIRNAGGNWVDQEVAVCSNGANTLVTSRKPDDLEAFCAKLVEVFAAGGAR
ncbi:MAG TPA: type 1 glutamine amidotransferase domain-containing protein [Acidimicrobiia bacterium]|nr:type 1 glutamine amidotransferase domain-containing protein [Acidimicrobiia bacterium]